MDGKISIKGFDVQVRCTEHDLVVGETGLWMSQREKENQVVVASGVATTLHCPVAEGEHVFELVAL